MCETEREQKGKGLMIDECNKKRGKKGAKDGAKSRTLFLME